MHTERVKNSQLLQLSADQPCISKYKTSSLLHFNYVQSGLRDIKQKARPQLGDALLEDYFTAERRRQAASAPASPRALSLLLINLRVRKPPKSQTPMNPPQHTARTEGVISNGWS